MTFQNRIPLNIHRMYFDSKDTINTLVAKIEVLTDSTAIIYSIRILIVTIALVMGYIHTSQEKPDATIIQKQEIVSPQGKLFFKK